jgi:hypothetical protein
LLRLCPKETFVVHFRYFSVDVSHPILLFMESIGDVVEKPHNIWTISFSLPLPR